MAPSFFLAMQPLLRVTKPQRREQQPILALGLTSRLLGVRDTQVLIAQRERNGLTSGGTAPGGYMKMAGISQVNALNSCFQNLNKIDTIVLP